MTGREPEFRHAFFNSFSFERFFIKSNGLFFLAIGGISTAADWSKLLKDLQDSVAGQNFAIVKAYFIWESLFFGYEMLRLKLRRDIALAKWENRRKRATRKQIK